MLRLTTGIRSEKCVVRRLRPCANVIECTYTNLDNIQAYILYVIHNNNRTHNITCYNLMVLIGTSWPEDGRNEAETSKAKNN